MSTLYRQRSRARRRGRGPRHALLLLMFAFMLLAPIGGQVATARQADEVQRAQPTEEPDEADDGGEEPQVTEEPEVIETEEPQPTEEPEVVETEEPMATEEPEGEQLGAIEIDYWECPPTYDVTNPDLENLFMECEGANDVQFVVQPAGGGNPQSQDTGEFGDSHVSFTELPTGPTQFMSENTAAVQVVFCNGIVQHGGPETGYQNVPLSNGVANWNLLDDEIVFCSWLVIEQAEPADLLVHKFACPAGYDEEANDADPMEDCTEEMDGVTFVLTDDDPQTPDIQTDTGDSIPGAVMFGGTAGGDYTLTETLPDDVDRAFLWDCTVEDTPPTDPSDLPLNEGDSWDLTMTGKDMECYWFNVLSEDAATEPVTEEPTEEGTEEPTEPTGDQVGAFEIEYRECPDGYTFLDAMDEDELDQMLQECAQVDGVEFTIDQGGPDGNTQETGEFGDSHISFTEVPTGMRTVTQTEAFATTYVVCEGIVSNGGPETGLMDMAVSNGSIQWNLLDDEIAYCTWFVMGEGGGMVDPLNEQVGSININYWECPTTTDFATISDDGLATECTDSRNGVVFGVTSGTFSETQATGDINDGVVAFGEVPTGTISVKQLTPPQQLIVICQGIVSNGGPETAIMRLPITQATIEWNLLDDEVVYCDWYVIPLAEGFADVAINKHACPEGFDAYNADIYELAANCHEDPGTVAFNVTSGAYNQNANATGGGNYAEFTDVPSGSVTVTETVPDGYAEPIVYCKVEAYPSLDDVVPTHRVQLSGGNSFTRVVGDSQLLWCDVFNVVDPGYAEVAINKHACPAGFDAYNADIYELAANCHEDPGSVPFTVTSGSFSETASATGGGNYASFPQVPAGTLTITETVPDGYGMPIVYCKVELALDLSDIEPTTLYPVDDNASFSKSVMGGHLLWCDVFNVPEDDSTITVTKFHCPEGTGYEEDDAWYQENCTEYHEDVQFKLTHSDGDEFGTTDGNGQVMWDGVPMGPFSIQEYIPEGYGDPVMICGMTAMVNGAIADGFPQRVEAPGGYLESEIGLPNTDYFCFWYNIPAGPGEITIFKYTCPEGYDVHAWGADPMEDCTEGTNGVTFTLEGMGYASQSDTGDSIQYAVYFGGLEPGPYAVTESVPANTQYAFVWDCYGQRMGELRPTPLSMGDTLDIAVGAGESITCYWYNVPGYDPEYGRLTVYKYECNTAVFVSEVDCELYEGGQDFDLVWWNGDAWEFADTRTTDGAGKILWVNVPPGEYWLDEHDREWCHMTSEQISDDGNWLNVYEDQETVVKVYNCTGQPGKPGKTPTKYPNTGIGPMREEWRLTA